MPHKVPGIHQLFRPYTTMLFSPHFVFPIEKAHKIIGILWIKQKGDKCFFLATDGQVFRVLSAPAL